MKHYFGGLYYRIDEHHVFLLGGGLAFSLFVCIIPFVLIVFAVLGNILDSTYMQYQVNLLIDTIIPYYQYSEFVKKIIFTRINEVIEYRNIAGIIGGFGLLIAASGLFSSMRTILNKVFGIETDVNILLGKLRDFALIIMVIIIFFITTILMPVLDLLRQYASEFKIFSFFESGIFEHIIFSLISLTIIFVVFSILYYVVPIKKLNKKATIISALWAAILWEAAKQLFGYYLYNFSAFGKIYGTYALIIVVAFWIYYSSIVFIIGAEIGRLYFDRKYAMMSEVEII
ncbi:MAG: YihY/virulence factor BrkB family protein [Ignavibacteriaceae bacterium]